MLEKRIKEKIKIKNDNLFTDHVVADEGIKHAVDVRKQPAGEWDLEQAHGFSCTRTT